jgi:hypothetical protein
MNLNINSIAVDFDGTMEVKKLSDILDDILSYSEAFLGFREAICLTPPLCSLFFTIIYICRDFTVNTYQTRLMLLCVAFFILSFITVGLWEVFDKHKNLLAGLAIFCIIANYVTSLKVIFSLLSILM